MMIEAMVLEEILSHFIMTILLQKSKSINITFKSVLVLVSAHPNISAQEKYRSFGEPSRAASLAFLTGGLLASTGRPDSDGSGKDNHDSTDITLVY